MVSPFADAPLARVRSLVSVLTLCLVTAACATAPDRLHAGPDPSEPSVRVPAVGYRPVVSGYVSQRPVEPAPWRQQNDRVAPTEKP